MQYHDRSLSWVMGRLALVAAIVTLAVERLWFHNAPLFWMSMLFLVAALIYSPAPLRPPEERERIAKSLRLEP